MALFGTFKDIAPDEVLGLVENKEGVLEVGKDVRIYIKDGFVSGMEFRGRKLTNKTHYMAILMDVLSDRDSPFRFYRGKVEEIGEKIPVSLLILESAVKKDELNRFSLDTIGDRVPFVMDDGGRERLNHLLSKSGNAELVEFIKDAYYLLKKGASPLEISRKLNLPLEWTKYMIYRLRVLKIVKVKRRGVDEGILNRVKRLYRKISFLLRRSGGNEQDI